MRMILRNWTAARIANPIVTAALVATVWCNLALAQTTQPVIFVDVENLVNYYNDLVDQPKPVPNPGITPAAPNDALGVFPFVITIGDIVAVNGRPARGTAVFRVQVLNLAPPDAPPENGAPSVLAVSDTMRAGQQTGTIEILNSDRAPIGIFTLIGLGGTPPVGAPASISSFNYTIVGGTGAFFGVRGQAGHGANPPGTGPAAARNASMAENPANRRINGGGRRRYALQVIPHVLPQVVAVFHADFSPVTAAQPAKAGEVLVLQATGLGPTLPSTEPGTAFPLEPMREVNSPVDLSVNGTAAEILNKFGWPGRVDLYRVDVRVPDSIASGPAALQLTAAWIAGPTANIPIQ